MCRALRVLCAALGAERLSTLKRAAVSAYWELAGGAATLDQLAEQIALWEPDVIVADIEIGPEAVSLVREVRPSARLVLAGATGPVEGADECVNSLEDVRAAILGLPRPGGPVGVRPPTEPRRTP